jgi:hypothetical protein
VPFFGRRPDPVAAPTVRRRLVVPPLPRAPGAMADRPAPHPPAEGDRRASVVELTRRCNEIFEEQVRHRPEEWVWWHKRWRRKPIPRLDLDADIKYQNTVLS